MKSQKPKSSPRHNVDQSKFPFKLWQLLTDCTESADDSVRWSDDGEHLIINETSFCQSSVVQRLFNVKFSSFIRQLNSYGFRKIDPNVPQCVRFACFCRCHSTFPFLHYQHDYFRRSMPNALTQVVSRRRAINFLTNDTKDTSQEKIKDGVISHDGFEKSISNVTPLSIEMLEPLDKTMFWQFDEESVYLDIEIETSEGAQENELQNQNSTHSVISHPQPSNGYPAVDLNRNGMIFTSQMIEEYCPSYGTTVDNRCRIKSDPSVLVEFNFNISEQFSDTVL